MITRSDIPRKGLVTTRNWLITPDGGQNHAFWCAEWLLKTDKDLDLAGFKSADRWVMIAMQGQEVLAIIPGCEVIGYMLCSLPPSHSVYVFNKAKGVIR